MPQEVLLTYDEQSYAAEALQKAAYRALNAFTVDVSVSAGNYQCRLVPNAGVSDEVFQQALEEFRKDVLDYQLRLKLKAETEPVRNLILGVAFSRTGLQSSE